MEKAIKLMVAVAAVAAVLALAPTAFAQSTGTGYSGQAGGVAGQVQQGGNGGAVAGEKTSGGNGTAASNATSGNGVLPFTGADLALIAGGGLVLLGAGIALSRLVARETA